MQHKLIQSVIWFCLLAISAPGVAWASRGIADGGEFFGDAEQSAGTKIEELFAKHHKDIRIETFAAMPEAQQAKLKQLGSEPFFKGWLVERAKAEHVDGLFILICRQPAMIKVGINESTRKTKFNDGDREALWKLIKRRFDKQEFDAGLLDGLKYISDRFEAHGGVAVAPSLQAEASEIGHARSPSHELQPPMRGPGPRPLPAPVQNGGQPGAGMMSLIVFGIIVFVAFLVIRGLFRALSGGAGGFGGSGTTMSGGGGWGTGIFSGILGAFAGNALYDTFFRGHSSSSWGNSASASETHNALDGGGSSSESNTSDGWSVNDGGSFGDASGGSSDFGGGGDFGGGSDF